MLTSCMLELEAQRDLRGGGGIFGFGTLVLKTANSLEIGPGAVQRRHVDSNSTFIHEWVDAGRS
jgi:hypothetical protein